jgi:hypothetical protein
VKPFFEQVFLKLKVLFFNVRNDSFLILEKKQSSTFLIQMKNDKHKLIGILPIFHLRKKNYFFSLFIINMLFVVILQFVDIIKNNYVRFLSSFLLAKFETFCNKSDGLLKNFECRKCLQEILN